MPNKSVLAAAEGVSRSQPNSLSAAIFRYRANFNAFLALPSGNGSVPAVEVEARYKSSMKLLEAWSHPAETQLDAATALRLALEDYESGETPRIPAMINAALGFLERASADEEDTSASAKGVPTLLNVIDELDHARSFLDLVSLALDGMGSDREINAIQAGVMAAVRKYKEAYSMLEAHREAAR